MKKSYNRKLKNFPLATFQKKNIQQWNILSKPNNQYNRLFKNKSRFFSMEYGRSLSKRILWQISLFTKKSQQKSFQSLKFWGTFEHNWVLFRSILFGKMWMFDNPSLVPGSVWPNKSGKILLVKMRAFKALTHLFGKANKTFVVKNLNKLWNLSQVTMPPLWSIASGIDSLKTSVLVKSGFVPTLGTTHHLLSRKQVYFNGFKTNKFLGYTYPGDIVYFNEKLLFQKLLSLGVASYKVNPSVYNSVYSHMPFLWVSSFYQSPEQNFSFKKNKKR